MTKELLQRDEVLTRGRGKKNHQGNDDYMYRAAHGGNTCTLVYEEKSVREREREREKERVDCELEASDVR
jgi:hypothetical protein